MTKPPMLLSFVVIPACPESVFIFIGIPTILNEL
jgi:hypothetical protein